MYRKLLASTALSLLISSGAYAQAAAPADPATTDPAAEAPADSLVTPADPAQAPVDPAQAPADPADPLAAPADPADPLAAPADPLADPAATEAPEQPLVSAAETGINSDGWLATEIIGATIYNSTSDDAEEIGEVNDFVLGQDGGIAAVVVGVGGFLGIGQKNVAINWQDLELTQDMNGDNRLVANMTREQLETAAEFNREEWLASESNQGQPADPAASTGGAMAPAVPAGDTMAPAGGAMAPAAPADDAAAPADDTLAPTDDTLAPADDAAVAPTDDAAATDPAETGDAAATDTADSTDTVVVTEDAATQDPAATTDGAAASINFDTFEQVSAGEISADELTGTAVYGANDEEVGSIGDILLSEDGMVEAVIIDFGGFLGIGTKPVAVAFDNLTFLRDENGALVLRTPLTAEQLEAAPEYNEEAYLASPEENTLMVQ